MDDVAKGRWRFRLVELVVVVGILALLAALVVPAIQRARESQRRTQCSNNLKQVCLGLLNYEHQNKTFPPGMICDKGEDPAFTDVFRPNWAILTYPYRDGMPLQRSFDATIPISHDNNGRLRGELIPWLLCPSDAANNRRPFNGTNKAEGGEWARGNYAVNAGNVFIGKGGGVVDANSAQWKDNLRHGVMAVNDCTMNLEAIRDGTSNTILAGEIRAGVTDKDRRGVWAMGMAGSSIACAQGSWGDANGPNACNRWADDIKGGDQIKIGPAAEDQCMDPWGGSGSRQATFRSLHPGGCNVVFADNSVHFISDTIETSGPWGDPEPNFWPIWDRLICSADHRAIGFGRHWDETQPIPDEGLAQKTRGVLRVRGTVRFTDGTVPAGEYRFITFHPDIDRIDDIEPAKGAGSEIKPDGRFEMTTVKPGDGVLPGHYKVTIKCLKNYADPDSLTIPKKYAEFSTTPLEVEIEKSRSDVEFVLEK